MSTSHRAFSAGGGAYVAYLINRDTENTNTISFALVNFTSNSATMHGKYYGGYGGGVAVASEFGNLVPPKGSIITFTRCKWRYNTAIYSPAVDIAPFFFRSTDKSGFLPIP